MINNNDKTYTIGSQEFLPRQAVSITLTEFELWQEPTLKDNPQRPEGVP